MKPHRYSNGLPKTSPQLSRESRTSTQNSGAAPTPGLTEFQLAPMRRAPGSDEENFPVFVVSESTPINMGGWVDQPISPPSPTMK